MDRNGHLTTLRRVCPIKVVGERKGNRKCQNKEMDRRVRIIQQSSSFSEFGPVTIEVKDKRTVTQSFGTTKAHNLCRV